MRPRSVVIFSVLLFACEKTAYVGSPVDSATDLRRDASLDHRRGETARQRGWAVAAGGSGEDLVKAIVADGQGHLLVSGVFTGEARFDELALTAAPGEMGVFVARLDSSTGAFHWVVPLDAVPSAEAADGLAVDAEGNVYYAGSVAATGAEDILLVKLAPTGRLLSTTSAGGQGRDRANQVAVDAAGRITLCGFFEGSATFGRHTLTAQGSSDIFVARLERGGDVLWATRAGGPSLLREGASGLALDDAGNTFVTGSFAGKAGFGSISLEASTQQLFSAKLDGSGAFLSAAAPALGDPAAGRAITLGGRGKVYLGGKREHAGGLWQPLLARLEGSTFLWTSLLADAAVNAPAWVEAVAADASGFAVAAGGFSGTRQLGSKLLAARGEEDLFITRVDPSGSPVWSAQAGGAEQDGAIGLALDADDNIYVAGGFRSSASFEGRGLVSRGASDAFIWKTRASE